MRTKIINDDDRIDLNKHAPVITIKAEDKENIHNLITKHKRTVVNAIKVWLEGTTIIR